MSIKFLPTLRSRAQSRAFAATSLRSESLEARTLLSGTTELSPFETAPAIVATDEAPALTVSVPPSLAAATGDNFINIHEPSGNYVMRPEVGTISLPSSLLSDPDITGVALRDSWQNVNPAPGVYNWSRLDTAINTITAAGKQFKIAVYTGTSTPEWVYAQGARSFTFTETGGFRPQGTYKMPVPWDNVMLTAYEDLLREMDRHFGSNPNLVAIGLGGPTQFSIEMHLPPETQSLPDFSYANVRGAWDRVLTTYAGLFPNVRGALHLANPFHYSDQIAQQVATDAIAILGPRLALQHNALSAKSDLPNYNIHQIVSQATALGVHVGFEELSGSGEARFGGSYATAWQRVIDARARYVDFYISDQANLQFFPNAAPTFLTGNKLVVRNDGVLQAIAGWANRIQVGPRTESGQGLSFSVIRNTRPDLFSSLPNLDVSTGKIAFSSLRGASGVAEITVVLRDTGGTAQGGSDTSLAKTFTIEFTPYIGDLNGDGQLNNLDITSFEKALASHDSGGPAPNLVDYAIRGDVNGDGFFNNLDIQPFERLLTAPAATAEGQSFVAAAVSADLAIELPVTLESPSVAVTSSSSATLKTDTSAPAVPIADVKPAIARSLPAPTAEHIWRQLLHNVRSRLFRW